MVLFHSCKQKENIRALPYYNDATFTPNWLDVNAEQLDDFHTIAPFEFLNQDGEKITDQTLAGKIHVADFFFTSCPGICPRMTNNLSLVQDAFALDTSVVLLSYSVTPEKDSVSVLKAYAENKGIQSGKWHLLTGQRQEIYELGRKSYFAEEDLGEPKGEDDFLHTEHFFLIDGKGHLRGIYNGLNKNSVNELISDIATLQSEAPTKE